MDSVILREAVTEAIRYWERRRIVYNAVLATIVLGYFVAGLPSSKVKATFDLLEGLFVLAVLANVAYCTAYIVDVFAQMSGFRHTWLAYRWVLLLIGILFAGIITRAFAIGMFSIPQN